MAVFFTSDTHLGHKGIIDYQPETRGKYKNIDEMDAAIIKKWNDKIKPSDTVYHLGDVAWSKPNISNIKRLHGKKILVPGNHDINLLKKKEFSDCWDTIAPSSFLDVVIDGQVIVLCHYPIWEWRAIQHGSWHLHGHVHAKPTGVPGKILDVGVDNNCLEPFSFLDVKRFMDQRPCRLH